MMQPLEACWHLQHATAAAAQHETSEESSLFIACTPACARADSEMKAATATLISYPVKLCHSVHDIEH